MPDCVLFPFPPFRHATAHTNVTQTNRPQVGAFTAASNITGLCVDVDAVTALLHKYGALAFWDYATAAPYIKVRRRRRRRRGKLTPLGEREI